MIIISLKKYMFIDLAMLTGLGILAEVVGLIGTSIMLTNAIPTFCFALLIMMIALSRWNYKGLIIAPIIALATFLTGRLYIEPSAYDLSMYFTILAGLLSTSVSLIWFRFMKPKELFKDPGFTALFAVSNIIAAVLVSTTLYYVINQNALANTNTAFSSVLIQFLVYDAFGMVIALVGIFVLRGQETLLDVKQKLIDERNAREHEAAYEKEFQTRLYENSDTSLDETKSKDENENS